jgi:hypothetical protein
MAFSSVMIIRDVLGIFSPPSPFLHLALCLDSRFLGLFILDISGDHVCQV